MSFVEYQVSVSKYSAFLDWTKAASSPPQATYIGPKMVSYWASGKSRRALFIVMGVPHEGSRAAGYSSGGHGGSTPSLPQVRRPASLQSMTTVQWRAPGATG